MKRLLLGILISITYLSSAAQDFSNKGKDFWVGYGYHQIMVSGNTQQMVLYFATEAVTNVTVTIPGLGYSQTYSNIPANTIFTTAALPSSGTYDARLLTESLYNSGIHITSDKPIVAYAHIYNASVSGATLLFPTNTLGKEYYSVNYKNTSNSANANCWFYVVAADTGTTTVEITPSAATLSHAAGVPFTVNLTQGQIYNVMGQLTTFTDPYQGVDLTGSRVRSISTGTSGCKRIAVFSGSGRISITCNNSSSSSDNYMVQSLPKTAWGQKYLTVPTSVLPNNFYRICVTDPATIVKLNGVVINSATLINNFYYQLGPTNVPNLIEADKPVMVAQYITSQAACGNGNTGDPEVIYLSSVEQNINKVILNSTSHFQITQHYINVIIPKNGTALTSFRIDGNTPSSGFLTHPQDPNYAYLQQQVSAGQHTVQSDSGFNAIAYGYGAAESYGYNAGTNVKDLYQFVGIINPYSIVTQPSACSGSPFYFSITLPYQPLSLFWDFHGFQTPNVTQTNPIADTTYLVNGKQVWRYKIPTPYLYAVGTYPVTVTANNPTPEGCSGQQDIDFDLNVYNPPTANFYTINNGCVSDSVKFRDTSTANGTIIYRWYWDFGDGTFSNSKNPSHLYNTPGTYNVRYHIITDVGCLSDTITKQVTVTQVPIANFGISAPECDGKPITFSDSSSTVSGTLIKWYWDYGDGIKDTVNNNSDRIHSYTPWGNKTATLKVETNSGCRSNLYSKTFYVAPNPVANFTMPAGLCLPADSAHFFDASTIADNTQAGFTYLWTFGDPPSGANNNSTIKNPAHYYNNAGPFSINLKVTSAAGCFHDTTKVLSSVYPQAHADFTVNPETCLNDVTSFTSTSTGNGSTVTSWFWDFGDGSAISTTQNPTHTFATANTYTVRHWIKTDKGCTSDTMTKQVTINPLPAAKFGVSLPDCVSKNITFSDSSVANVGNITLWKWDLGDGTLLTLNNNNPFTHTYAASGNYTVTLSVETNKGCKSTLYSKQVTVNPSPVPDFSMSPVCLPSGIAQFTDLSTISDGTQSSFTYLWNFGEPSSGLNNTSTLKNPTHLYASVGPFNVTLTVTSGNGCVKDTIKQLTQVYAQPTANFTVAPENCLNDVTAFTDQSNGQGGTLIEWHWNFGDGQTSTLQNPTHTYTLPGTYTVKLSTKTDKGCLSDTSTKQVTINPLPSAKFGISSPDCATKNVTFSDSSVANVGTITLWEWDLGDGTILNLSNGNSFTHAYATAGTFTVTLSVQTNKGCKSTVYTQQVIIHPLPVVDFSMSPVCLPSGVSQFNDLSTIADGTQNSFTYSWNFGDPGSGALNSSTLKNPTHTYSSVGPFNVTLTVTSSSGCIKDSTKQLTQVYAQPSANFNVAAENCLNDVTTFTDQSSGQGSTVTEWHWNFGDGQTSTLQNPTHSYATANTYTVSLYIKTDKGCVSDTIRKQVTVNPLPTAAFTNSLPTCETKTVTFTNASAANAGNINLWHWDLGDGTLLNLTNNNPVTHTYTTVGTYTVTLSVETDKGCKSTLTSRQIIIHAQPIANFILPQVCLNDAFALFTDSSYINDGTGGLFTYLWNFGDPSSGALNTSTQKNPQHKYNAVGIYNVTLSVTSSNGCVATITKPFTVNGAIPRADFTVLNQNNLCSNTSVQIKDSSTVDFGSLTKIEIYWDFTNNPGTFDVDLTPTINELYSHTYATSSTTKVYSVHVRAYSGGACVSEKIINITVNATPNVQFNTIPNACFTSAPYQITQASEVGGVTGTGVFTGPSISSSGIFDPSVAGVGTHTLRYTFTSNKGCVDFKDQTITVVAPPTAKFGYSSPDCETKSVTFSDSSNASAGTLTTWTWDFGDGTPVVVKNSNAPFAHTFATANTYTVKLTVTSSDGCNSAAFTQSVKINPQPVIDFTLPKACLPNANAVFNDASTIADGTQSGFTYLWNFGDASSGANNTSTQKNPSHIYSALGPYTVSLTVTSNNGCISVAQKQFNDIHPAPVAKFSSNTTEVCQGSNITFTDLSTGGDTTLKAWQWNFGDGITSTQQNPPAHTFNTSGNLNVQLVVINNNNCLSAPFTLPVIIDAFPTVDAGPDRNVLEGGTIALEPIITGTNLTYLWTPSTYLNNPTIKNPIVTGVADQLYTITVTTAGGCTKSDQVLVKVLKFPKIPNTFTPNNDGINDSWVIQYLETYPGNRVQVFNRYGQLVFESRGYVKPWDGTMNGKPLPFGTYYYIIEPGNGRKPLTGYVTLIK